MNVAPRQTARPNASLSHATKAKARRDEALDVRQTAEQHAAGRCACGLALPAPAAPRCEHCQREHSKAVKSAFVGL